jgi:DNA polymerase-1
MLRKLQAQYTEIPVVVVFDAKGKTFRDELFAEYKANRPPMPDDLRAQIAPLHACVEALGLPMIVQEGVEADDVIGTLALQRAAKGKSVLISTGDKDMAQLVDEQVSLVNTMTDTFLNPEGVREKFGVPPELIIDFLALIGDKSDNIPGVPGVGEKSALPMLQAIGDMDAIYENLEAVRELEFRGAKKMPEKLLEHKDQAYLSRELATIKTDVSLDLTDEQLVQGEADSGALRQLYADLEFRSWLEDLETQGDPFVAEEPIEANYETVLDTESLNRWIEILSRAEEFAFDTETTSLKYMEAKLVGFSFSTEPGSAAYVPVGHDYMDAPEQLSLKDVLAALTPLLQDKNKILVGQHIKYDMNVLAQAGVEIKTQLRDTMLESYVLDSVAGRHDMDSLAMRVLSRKTIKFEDVAGKGAKQIGFNQVSLEEASPYAAEDADITLQLHQRLWPVLDAEEKLKNLYLDIECPLIPVLSRIERNGALIDGDAMFAQSHEISEKLREIEQQVHKLAGQEFNLGSTKQLREILFDKLELPIRKKTPKGEASTAEEVLIELAMEHEIPRLLLDFRGLSKLKSTYTDKLPLLVNSATGRLHTSYHQAVAATGRLSSTDPNLQNIPVRTEEGRRIRKAFIAPEGKVLIAADYSQIELRIMAHLSGDKGLLHAFANDLDVHAATAAEVFDVELGRVTSDQRRSAKAINFGLMYGMSAFGLGRQLRIPRGEAQNYIDTYFERYPGVKDFMDRIRKQAAEQGYVETLFGRRLNLPEIGARQAQLRQAAERTAINAPMQGSAADIIKLAMIAVDRLIRDEYPDAMMIMQVHDELVLEVAEDQAQEFADRVRELMQDAASLDVPLIVDVGIANNWEQAH